MPSADLTGWKPSATTDVKIQLTPAATAMALARGASGSISPAISHGIAPNPTSKKVTYSSTSTMASGPSAPDADAAVPLPLTTSTTVSATPASAMPDAPTSSSGRRPALSMRYIASTVASTLTMPAASVPIVASLMPASCRGRDWGA